MASFANKKRKQYVIDRKFQYKMILAFIFTIIAALLIFSTVIIGYYWVSSMVGDNVFKEYIQIDKQIEVNGVLQTKSDFGVKRWEIVVPPILLNNLIIIIFITIFGIFYSHRIAGPIYRINAEIKRVISGETGVRVKLRDKDKMKDLAENINQLLIKFDDLNKSG